MTHEPPARDAVKLLPCPFCGEAALFHNTYVDDDRFGWVACVHCDATSKSADRDEAFAFWNTRLTTPSQDYARGWAAGLEEAAILAVNYDVEHKVMTTAARVIRRNIASAIRTRALTPAQPQDEEQHETAFEISKRRYEERTAQSQDGIEDDVRELVVAARIFWETRDDMSEESRDLDKALEAFSIRVPYENEPDEAAITPAHPKSPLERMVELDEELEAEHPGWMTGKVPSSQPQEGAKVTDEMVSLAWSTVCTSSDITHEEMRLALETALAAAPKGAK